MRIEDAARVILHIHCIRSTYQHKPKIFIKNVSWYLYKLKLSPWLIKIMFLKVERSTYYISREPQPTRSTLVYGQNQDLSSKL
jgi:hypothetical protein